MQKYGISVIIGKILADGPFTEMGLWTFILKYEPRLRAVNRLSLKT